MSTKFLNATYLKSADKHILHTYAQMCTHMLVSFFFFSPPARSHAHARTHTNSHALVRTHIPQPACIINIHYDARIPHFASATLWDAAPQSAWPATAFTVGLWHALQQQNLVSSIRYMRVGLLRVRPYWLVMNNNLLFVSGWVTSIYLHKQKCCSKKFTVIIEKKNKNFKKNGTIAY